METHVKIWGMFHLAILSSLRGIYIDSSIVCKSSHIKHMSRLFKTAAGRVEDSSKPFGEDWDEVAATEPIHYNGGPVVSMICGCCKLIQTMQSYVYCSSFHHILPFASDKLVCVVLLFLDWTFLVAFVSVPCFDGFESFLGPHTVIHPRTWRAVSKQRALRWRLCTSSRQRWSGNTCSLFMEPMNQVLL